MEGTDGFDESQGADGDEILNAHAGALEATGEVGNQAEVAFDEEIARPFGVGAATLQGIDGDSLVLSGKRLGKDLGAVDVVELRGGRQAVEELGNAGTDE